MAIATEAFCKLGSGYEGLEVYIGLEGQLLTEYYRDVFFLMGVGQL